MYWNIGYICKESVIKNFCCANDNTLHNNESFIEQTESIWFIKQNINEVTAITERQLCLLLTLTKQIIVKMDCCMVVTVCF